MVKERIKLLQNVRLVDASAKKTDGCDLIVSIRNGRSKILQIGKNLRLQNEEGASILNAHGKTICPGFTCLRCRIPDPGYAYREDYGSGFSSALAGGYLRLLLEPASLPLPDEAQTVRDRLRAAGEIFGAHAGVSVPLTRGGRGKEPCDYEKLRQAGALAISLSAEQTEPDSAILMRALEFCKESGMLFLAGTGDRSLDKRGTLNRGRVSKILKEPGIEPVSELLAIGKILLLAKSTGAKVHIPLLTLRESVEAVRRAKEEGVRVTCATAPPYFCFTDEEPLLIGSPAKLLPPLRGEEDRQAIVQGLADGTIDCICSDHDPKTAREKSGTLSASAPGAVGFETAFAAGITHLVLPGKLSLYRLIELMSLAPAKILGKDASIREGGPCDFLFIDPGADFLYNRSTLRSRCCNTPFLGRSLRGRVTGGFLDGEAF